MPLRWQPSSWELRGPLRNWNRLRATTFQRHRILGQYVPMTRCAALVVALGVLACSSAARAALGGDARSVLTDAAQLHADVLTEDHGLYQVQTLTSASGVRVREYLHDNLVIALSWAGTVPPDLHLLLGEHYAGYTAALATAAHPGLHRTVHVLLAGATIDQSGHLRAYRGRAYLPVIQTAGLTAADLQ